MASIWVESLGRSFEQALDLLAAAVRDCTDELWETTMWHVPATDPAQRRTLAQRWVQRWATPWSVAWHALEVLDYDLTGEFGPWAPPPPFIGHPHWRDLTSLPAAWSQSEMLAYIDYCRHRVRNTLPGMSDEKGATPLPPAHRHRGQPHAWIITGLMPGSSRASWGTRPSTRRRSGSSSPPLGSRPTRRTVHNATAARRSTDPAQG
jgi:hypothetical protein